MVTRANMIVTKKPNAKNIATSTLKIIPSSSFCDWLSFVFNQDVPGCIVERMQPVNPTCNPTCS